MVETMTAFFLTLIAIVALMPMQDNAIKVMSRSDFLGRAEGIMQSELEFEENYLMNSTGTIPGACPITTKNNLAVYASGLAAPITGDNTFYLTTCISQIGLTNSWTVNVQVSWNDTTGISKSISNSIIVSRL
jgi:hypothetical protein